MGSVRELPHTADIGFEVEAETLDRLFTLAATGLVRATGAEPEPDAGSSLSTMELRRPSLDRLLVAWLRELLLPILTDGRVPAVRSVEVRPGDADGGGPGGGTPTGDGPADGGGGAGPTSGGAALEAEVEWRPWRAAGPEREIKGVTYHGLRVARRDGDWHARVVLDV